MCQAARLRDGRPVVEFLRANPHFGGVSQGETATGFGEVLTAPMLRRLEARGGIAIIYTHLGKCLDRRQPFTPDGIAGLRRLAAACRDGRLLVTTTRRLLGYARLRDTVTWTARQDGQDVQIDVTTGGIFHGRDLDGLSFYVDDPARTRLTVDGRGWPLQAQWADDSGRPSVSIPWRRLALPAVAMAALLRLTLRLCLRLYLTVLRAARRFGRAGSGEGRSGGRAAHAELPRAGVAPRAPRSARTRAPMRAAATRHHGCP